MRPGGPLPVYAVLHVTQPTDAGVARCVLDYACDQRTAGLAVTVACPPAGPLAETLRAEGIAVSDWPATRSPGPAVASETVRLRRIVRRTAPDLVHLHSSKAGLAGRLALRGSLPTVFQPHAWSFDAVTGAVRRASLAWERAAARWADRIVCVSEAERAAGAAAGIAARWALAPNGVDLSAYAEAGPAERRAARDRLGLDADAPLVVCVGRLCRQKGQDVLLAAWPRVAAVTPTATLALVGDGPDAAALHTIAPPGVRFTGRRDDVADWLAAADVVAFPSRWEGMSLAVLEALARGRPVVASDVPGMREAVGTGAGAVVPPENAAALAAALTERLRDGTRRVAEGAAARRAAQRHDVRRTAAAVREIYAAVLAER